MWLVAGLGNPGDKYSRHRHNIGFMVADAIADEYGFSPFKSKFQAEMSEGRVGTHKVVLLKPQTFMNESGQSIGKAAKFFKIQPDRICVLHDELDLEPGRVKAKFGGGIAGHNGLRSTKAHLATADFWRVRLGIGHPGEKSRVSGYVLSDFAKAEQDWLERLIPAVAENIGLLLDGQDSDFTMRVSESVK